MARALRQRAAFAPARPVSPGRALMLVGLGHALWGLAAYRRPLREIAEARLAGAVGDGIFQREHSDDARAAAFWFMMAAPVAAGSGYLVERAAQAGDGLALEASGWTGVALGAIGVTAMPRSGFPVLPAIGLWLVREGRRVGRRA